MSLPESIGNLNQLQELNVYENQLSALPDSIGSLNKLEALYAWNNNFKSLPDSICKLAKLQILNVSSNQITELPSCIDTLQNLEELICTDNKLQSLPESVGNLSKLKILHIYDNPIKSLPNTLVDLPHFEDLWITNDFSHKVSKNIGDILNQLGDEIVRGLEDIKIQKSGTEINSSNSRKSIASIMRISGSGVETFSGMVDIATYLYFQENNVDLEEYYNDTEMGDNDLEIPDEHHFGANGLTEVDDIWHVNGAYLIEDNKIEILNDSDEVIWSCSCDPEDLEGEDVTLIATSNYDDIVDELAPNQAMTIGRFFQKGTIFDTSLNNIDEFDPSDLTIYYFEDESGWIITSIEYAGDELENEDSVSHGTGAEFIWEANK